MEHVMLVHANAVTVAAVGSLSVRIGIPIAVSKDAAIRIVLGVVGENNLSTHLLIVSLARLAVPTAEDERAYTNPIAYPLVRQEIPAERYTHPS